MTVPARPRLVAFLAVAGLVAALSAVSPASGGAPQLIDQTFMDLNLGQSYTTEPVEPFLFDNFTNQPTDVGNPIIGWGGVRVPIDLLAQDGPALTRATGLDAMLTPIDGLTEEQTRDVYVAALEGHDYSDPDGPGAFFREHSTGRPWTFGDLVDTSAPLPARDEALRASFARFSDQLAVVDDPTIPNTRSSLFERGTFQGDDVFDGDLDGYLLIGSDNQVDGSYLPRNYDEGADILAIRQRDDFAAGPNGGRAENILRIHNPDSSAYNGSFDGDIFNGATEILGIRANPAAAGGETPPHEVFAFTFVDGFWDETAPFGNVAVSGGVTIFEVPHGMLDGASFGFASFVQDGPQQIQGAVGSSAAPSLPGLFAATTLADFAPRPFDVDPGELNALVDELLGTVDAPDPVEPADPVADPAVPDPVVEPEPADGSASATSTDADGADGGGFPWEPVAIGGGVLAVVGGYVLSRSRDGEEDDDPPIFSTPDDDISPAHVCDWELHWLNGFNWDKLRHVAPGHHACCIYKVEIETTTTMHFITASFRQDLPPQRLYIPDPGYDWSGLNFHGHAATRSGPAGRQDWQHGFGDTVDQSALAPDEDYWQSSQGEERPEVAARIVHRETTTVSLTLESGCVDASHIFNASGAGELAFLSTQECTNDDLAAGCPVELNAFGRALAEVKGDLKWRLTHSTGTDIDELERADHPRPLWDSHDHEMLETATRPEEFSANDNNIKESFTWLAEVVNEVAFDAAQLVPEHVWPTTERVSAWVGTDADYNIDVTGVMTKGDCENEGCCGHDPAGHTCRCAPTFALVLNGASSVIKVDGTTTGIVRDTQADRQNPPEWFRGGLTSNPGPGVSRNWKTVT